MTPPATTKKPYRKGPRPRNILRISRTTKAEPRDCLVHCTPSKTHSAIPDPRINHFTQNTLKRLPLSKSRSLRNHLLNKYLRGSALAHSLSLPARHVTPHRSSSDRPAIPNPFSPRCNSRSTPIPTPPPLRLRVVIKTELSGDAVRMQTPRLIMFWKGLAHLPT